VFGNPNGGRARGASFDGQTALGLGIDLEKAIDLKGGIFNVGAFQNYGHGISASNIDNLSLVSNIEALSSARLYELWYQQSFFGGAIDVRLGQLGADEEFMITRYGSWFINSAFGWPTLPMVDLPAGGPSYPLATPGIRLRVKPAEPLTILLAAFNGDPAGPGLGNPQRRDASGALFRLGDGVFAIAEAQYAINNGKNVGGLPITLKVGGWYHDKATPNQFFANDGLTVVSAASTGSSIARKEWSGYAIADVMLLPEPNGKGGLAVFTRVDGAPAPRSKVSAELAAGIVYQGPFMREGDNVGFAVDSVRVGDPLGSIGALASQYTFHGYETVLELSYQAQALSWLQVQPDIQYVINPGGGIADPSQPGQRVRSAAVFGLRIVAAF
jgi:porin